ncbi:tissue-type plasminogen activator-like [Ciona intestinalis]
MFISWLLGTFLIVYNVKITLSCRQQWQQAAIDAVHELLDHELEPVNPTDVIYEKLDHEVIKTKSLFRSGGHNMNFWGPFSVYTDAGGCYEEDRPEAYTGAYTLSESGQGCLMWREFTKWIRQHSRNTMMAKRRKMLNTSWASMQGKDYSEEDAILKAANETIANMEEQGLVGHNFCRDFDGNGKPWCFVQKGRMIMWENCGVPVCTLCWRMRQRALRFKFNPMLFKNYWLPQCNFNGSFARVQCWKAYCWCSRYDGGVIRETLRKSNRSQLKC